MRITILTTDKKYINFDTENTSHYKVESPVFQFFEKLWYSWFEEESSHNSEIEDMYFSEEAIYTRKGAIRQAMELMEEIATEYKRNFFTESEIWKYDIQCAFS